MRLTVQAARVFRLHACAAAAIVAVGYAIGAAPAAFAQASAVECVAPAATATPPSAAPPSAPGSRESRIGDPTAQALARLQAPCGAGLVPRVKQLAPDSSGVLKGNPLLRQSSALRNKTPGQRRAASADAPACDGNLSEGSCYYYGRAVLAQPVPGAGMNMSVERPRFTGIGHTLAEISVQGGPEDGHIVEIGWNVSAQQYNDVDPHLFVFHWKNWTGTCYDGCGWVQTSQRIFPGQNLSALIGTDVFVGYAYFQGNWWAWFGNEWIGYFPGTEWNGQYQQASLVQWFGEVASYNGIPPQLAMGAGIFPTTTMGARLTNLCSYDGNTNQCPMRTDYGIDVSPQSATRYYQVIRIGASDVRYGGPGQ
jgi:hypothetical protein